MLIATIILALTYIGIIFTRLPHINIDRPAAAIAGGLLTVLLGVLTFQEATAAIDFNILALLLGMMLLIAALQRAGFFTWIAAQSIVIANRPWQLLVLVVATTAVGSALLVNDVVVLLFTPVVIRASQMLRVNPIPYLIAEAMASNIGSVATIVGNPQNMLIGISSGITFTRFLLYLLPVALVYMLLLVAIISVVSSLLTCFEPEQGMVIYLFAVPPMLAAAITFMLKKMRPVSDFNPALLSYAGATFGILLGADIFNLYRALTHQWDKPVFISIGGGSVLDAIFLAGIIALGADVVFRSQEENIIGSLIKLLTGDRRR